MWFGKKLAAEQTFVYLSITCYNMRHLVITIAFCWMLVSCRKDQPLFDGHSCSGSCFILTGHLTEAQSNSPLPGTELKFYYKRSQYTFFDRTEYLGSTTTASDGSYSFRFDSKDFTDPSAGFFVIEGERDGYIYRNAGDQINSELALFNLDSSRINIPQVNNLTLYKAAIIKFQIKAATVTNFDFLLVTYSYGTNSYGPVINGGRAIDTTLIYKTASDIPTFINWNALGNGVSISQKDTLIVPFGTEGLYQINL